MAKEGFATLNETNFNTTKRNNKVKIWVYSFKKSAISILFVLFAIGLISFSNSNFTAAKNGLYLWATSVIPALFPFFVATELLSYTNIISWLGIHLRFMMKPLFGIPGEGAFAFLMGLISGYPVGAKIVSNFREKGVCTKEEAERMLAFTNNSGPLFIIGTVGISLFGNTMIGILLFITHILACISVGIVLNISSIHQRKNIPSYSQLQNTKEYFSTKQSNQVTFSSLGEVLGKSITNSISTILLIGGFVVIFSVVISILNQSQLLDILSNLLLPVFSMFHIPPEMIHSFLSGIVELTNGVKLVASIPLKDLSISIIFCAFLLGFGGISILLQVFSIVSKSGLSIKKYFIGKLLQGFFAAFYTFISLQFLPWFQLNL